MNHSSTADGGCVQQPAVLLTAVRTQCGRISPPPSVTTCQRLGLAAQRTASTYSAVTVCFSHRGAVSFCCLDEAEVGQGHKTMF